MTLTSHGHHIPESTRDDEQHHPMVHRCGGVGVCDTCSREASMWRHPSNQKNRLEPVVNEDRSLELLVADYRRAEEARDDEHKAFLADQIEKVLHRDDACPTCSGPVRQTIGMKCPDCGTDYS